MTVVTVTDLYMFMGRELESLDCVPAGNVLGWYKSSFTFSTCTNPYKEGDHK